MAIEPFFVVWNPNRGLPRFKHPSISAAQTEARRLAAQHPGDEFFVLSAVGRAKVLEPVIWEDVDEIPF